MLITEQKIYLIFVKGPTDGLNDTTITAEVQYSINFSEILLKSSLQWKQHLFIRQWSKNVSI